MCRLKSGAAIFAAFLFPILACSPLRAQDVTLTSRDGTVSISGTLKSFDGEFYHVLSDYGELVLDGQGVLCAGPGCPDLDAYVAEFTIAGAPAIGSVLLPALLEAYASRRGLSVRRFVVDDNNFRMEVYDKQSGYDAAKIEFRLSSTGEGFADLLAQEADIVMAVREVRPAEVSLGKEAGLGDLSQPAQSFIVALDALVPVVARGNPVSNLQVDDLGALLSGETSEWDAQQAPVILHAREPGSGPLQLMEDKLLSQLGVRLSDTVVRHRTDAELSDSVASDPFSLGVTMLSEVGNAVPVILKGRCGMPATATRRTIKTEDYPFTAPLFLYTSARRLPLFAREFMRYLGTPSAQLVIRRAGFVDQSRELIPLQEQGIRLANAIAAADVDVPLSEVQRMVAALGDAARLTPTFRFRGGSARLDAQSAGNISDLARALEAGVFDDRELVFVGFGDGVGGWRANLKIARERAMAVRDAVEAAAFAADLSRIRLRVDAFGEAMPMACDDTEWGRGVNRRVEVWIR